MPGHQDENIIHDIHNVSQELMTMSDYLDREVWHLCCSFQEVDQGSQEDLEDDQSEEQNSDNSVRVENPS